MSSRLACWLNGHDWRPMRKSDPKYDDIFGNVWVLQWCDQCGASRRFLHRHWSRA